MTSRTITLCYRKLIDVNAAKPWEKMVFEDSYAELKMQAQLYNPENKYRSFGELIHAVPAAEKLHYLVSGAIIGYLRQLNDTIPDIINNLGKHFLKFTNFQFEIINSDLLDIRKHQVAVNFYSHPMVWHETIGNFLLVSSSETKEGEVQTHLFQIQPYLNIHSIVQES